MGDIDILNKFDNDKLIDVVKNYKRYGYDDELRDYAINLLGERGCKFMAAPAAKISSLAQKP